jgi:hypothetical protein
MPVKERRAMILEMAKDRFPSDGDGVEVDSNAKLSEGNDNGTYVAAWIWVDFSNTKLCKGDDGKHNDCSDGCPIWDAEVVKAT